MKKFEYKIERYLDFAEMEVSLRKLGLDGWELVSTFFDEKIIVAVFKKEK